MDEVLGTETLEKLLKTSTLGVPSDGKFERYEIEGIFLLKNGYPPSTIHAMKTWKARSDDVFVVSYPKAGTTWTQEVVSAICNNGDLDKVNERHTWFRVPYLEQTLFTSTEEIQVPPTHAIVGKMKSPRTIKSHLPGHILPPDILHKKVKIVYIARNPRDVAVSFFYFYESNPRLPTYTSWNDFFNDFYSGRTLFGPWWSHYLYYWKKRHEPNVLFLKFEDMKQDLKGTVQKIANFLAYTFTEDVIDCIVSHCTFENMKKNPMTNPDTIVQKIRDGAEKRRGKLPKDQAEERERISFMRKGKIGDWKNHFTVAQNEAMEALIQEKLAGSGLTFGY